MKRLLATILALAVLALAVPALAEETPDWLYGSWRLTHFETGCGQGSYSRTLDISATLRLSEGIGTHLTFKEGGVLDTDIDLPAVIAGAPEVPFDIPALSIGGTAYACRDGQITFLPSGDTYALRYEDGILKLDYDAVTLAHADGNPKHFAEGTGALYVHMELEHTKEPTPEPTEEPTPEPTKEPTPEPTEEPTPEPTEEPTPDPTEEMTPNPTEEPVDVAAYGPGLERVLHRYVYTTAQDLAEQYGVTLTDGAPLYAPAHPMPLNAYMVTHADCEVGIDRDGMYPVSEKGLVSDITDHLREWMDEITRESNHAIYFVDDPDDADVLVCARESFEYYGEYTGAGLRATGYSCVIQLSAWQLTDPANTATLSARKDPESTVSLRGGGNFWKNPPELEGTRKLADFVEAMLGWYGCGAKNGSRGAGVRALQQGLIDRGFLEGGADGSFGPRTEAAVKLLQSAYGLEPTGAVDRRTLVAAYYDPDAVKLVD